MLEGPGHEQTRIELHLLHGVKSGKIVTISGRAVELVAIDIDPDAALSVQGFAVAVVCVTFAVAFEAVIGASRSNFVIATGTATKAVELLVLGKDELDMVAMSFDTEVGCGSSTLLAKLGIANGVLEFLAIVLVAETFIGKVHVARACINI